MLPIQLQSVLQLDHGSRSAKRVDLQAAARWSAV